MKCPYCGGMYDPEGTTSVTENRGKMSGKLFKRKAIVCNSCGRTIKEDWKQ